MPRVSSRKFFAEQSAQSRVKADIIAKYAAAWATVMLKLPFNRSHEAAYADLFSGPGSYEDGARSTPLLIVEEALKKPFLSGGLRLYFNDSSRTHIESLRQEVGLLPGIGNLKFAPIYTTGSASISLINQLAIPDGTPQFYFLDQFGWADVLPPIVRHIFRNRMRECAFFFRTSRAIAAVTNPNAEAAMRSLFGDGRLRGMRMAFRSLRADKESIVLDNLRDVMREVGAVYFQPFAFRVREENSSKHHLIHLSQHEKALAIVKDIMGSSSSNEHNGVPLMGFTEAPIQPTLWEPDPVNDLQSQLLTVFAGRAMTVAEIFSQHHPTSRNLLLRNYQEALRRLEQSSELIADPSAADRPRRNRVLTMGEATKITFPKVKGAQ